MPNNSGRSSRSAAAQKAAATRIARKEELRRKREVRGIVCITIGILLGVYMFASGSGYFGEIMSKLPYGLVGFCAYIIPFLFFISGILIIRNSKDETVHDGPDAVFYLAIWDIVTLFHAFIINDNGSVEQVKYTGVDFFKFIANAYDYGVTTHKGGGAIGSIMCYPFLQFGGKAMAIVVLICLLIICVMLVTHFSIRDVGSLFVEKLHPSEKENSGRGVQMENPKSSRKKRLAIFETVDPDEEEEEYDSSFRLGGVPKQKQATRKRSSSSLAGFDEAFNSLSTASGYSVDRSPYGRKTIGDPDLLRDMNNLTPSTKKKKVRVVEVDDTDAHPYTGRKKVTDADAEELLPFGQNDYEVPTFLGGSGSKSKSEPPKHVRASSDKPVAKKKTSSSSTAKVKEAEEAPIRPAKAAGKYIPPPYNLLHPVDTSKNVGRENPMETAQILVDTLASFNIAVKILDYSVGPVITRFELQPAPGVRVSRIVGLSNDIALALAAPRVRIEAPIPGKAAVGIEIPNKSSIPVILREIVESKEFIKATSPITLAFGKDIAGKVITSDLGKMPHLLIAGSTGSGKSVCINDLIISMVYKSGPADLRMILIDPKVVELSPFSTLPHLLIPVVTEPKKAASALRWAVNEMMQRYQKFSQVGSRELSRYNELQKNEADKLPKLVVVIDELADLMMVAPDEVEDSICRIAQLGRAAGIHLIVATQRPSADIITGLIKANIPSRCAFAVSSGIDSRIILDTMGAEKLLGRGDMLFHPNGSNKPTRVQCAFVSDEEVENVVEYFREMSEGESHFDEDFVQEVTTAAQDDKEKSSTGHGDGKQEDELLPDAVRVVLESGSASISMIQRRLRVGYARAARLIDIMEQLGYVSGFEGSKPRKLLITKAQYERIFHGAGEGSSSAEDYTDAADVSDDSPFEEEDFDK